MSGQQHCQPSNRIAWWSEFLPGAAPPSTGLPDFCGTIKRIHNQGVKLPRQSRRKRSAGQSLPGADAQYGFRGETNPILSIPTGTLGFSTWEQFPAASRLTEVGLNYEDPHLENLTVSEKRPP